MLQFLPKEGDLFMDKAVNRKYKDRLFIRLFGYEDTKKDTLELYNAVNGSNYTDPDELTLYTIENVVYMGMKNDVAFCMESFLNLFEHSHIDFFPEARYARHTGGVSLAHGLLHFHRISVHNQAGTFGEAEYFPSFLKNMSER